MHTTVDEYRSHRGSTLDHFSEKLLLLKDRMNTESARRIAGERHQFMESFVSQFFAEWDGQA